MYTTAGDRALTHLYQRVDGLKIISVEHRATAMVAKGLGHALTVCQHSLLHAIRLAELAGLRIDDQGTVSAPPAGVPTDRVASFDNAYRSAIFLIDSALDAASQADRSAFDGFEQLSAASGQTDLETAIADDLNLASRLEMTMISGVLPSGNSAQNEVWWNSLSPEDQTLLKQAAASELECLPGIPNDVKNEVRGDSGYNRARAAGWAEAHWNDRSVDYYEDNNCTNFASEAMAGGGGLAQHGTFLFDEDAWGKGKSLGNESLDQKTHRRTDSWVQAPALKDVLLNNGGTVVSHTEARPGDLIFWEDANGEVHHTAVVTGNIDGDVRYTQHSTNQVDASLDERGAINGQEKTYVVRVNPNW
jgi:hypothetical protein